MGVATSKIRILHVDDDPDFAELVAIYLERGDDRISVETESSASEGLSRLAGEIDCVVSDYDMPGLNGIEFLEVVREKHPDLPFILFTAKGSEEIASEAISAGVTDYLEKNPNPEQYQLLRNRVIAAVERRHAETNYREIFENIPDGIVVHDPSDGSFVDMNSKFAEMFGYDREQLLDAGFETIHPDEPPHTLERARQHIQEASAQGAYSFEWHAVRKTGEQFWTEVHLAPTQLHGEDRILATVRDITDRKKRQQAMEELHPAVQKLMKAETIEKVAEIAVETAGDTLRLPTNTVHLYDERENCLVPVAWTESVEELVGEIPSFHPEEGLAWEVFETGEAKMYDDVSTASGRINAKTNVRSEIMLPLGGHGVLLVGSGEPNAFDETSMTLAQTLAAHTTTALDRIERERELEQYESMIETVPVGVFVIDETGEIVSGNDTGAELLGYGYDELHGQNFERLVNEGIYDAGIIDTYLDHVRKMVSSETDSDHAQFEYQATVDGRERTFEIHLTLRPFEDEFRGTIGIFRDVTEERRKQQTLERQNERLAEFASIVSHDLRNPLNVAQGRLKIVHDQSDSEALEQVAVALDRIEELIDDLMTLARQGNELGDVETVNLSETVKQCWQTVETAAATLEIETDQLFQADRSRLQQLLENLIHNAIEHGGSDVTVTVGDLADGFYVEDDGPGISKAERDEIFEAGYSTAETGTGFGLVIIHEIAEAHGWTINVTEGTTGGARFEIVGVGDT